MDNLILKLLCAGLIFVLYTGCHSGDNDDNMNDAYEQTSVNPTSDKRSETYESKHYGNRVGVEARMDSSANSKSPVDSNPK